jgi:hypothetical protein
MVSSETPRSQGLEPMQKEHMNYVTLLQICNMHQYWTLQTTEEP